MNEQTPNPDLLKFLSEKTISVVGTEEFQKKIKIKSVIILLKIYLKLKEHRINFISDKFLTVKKDKKVSWDSLNQQ